MERPRAGIGVRIGSFNAPESGKRGLIISRLVRAFVMLRVLNFNSIIIAALQESGTYMQRATKRSKRWASSYARPNTVIGRKKRGNGIVWRARLWRVIDAVDLVFAWKPRALHIPVRLMKHRTSGVVFAIICIHAPTRRADPDNSTRKKINDELIDYCQVLTRAGIPFVIAGDSNDGDWFAEFRRWCEVAMHHGVDWILISKDCKAHDHGVVDTRAKRISDHQGIWADIEIPFTKGITELPEAP